VQISFNEELATYAEEILVLFFGFNAFDETWKEETQEDGGKCWTNGFKKSCVQPLIRCIEEAATCPTVSHAVAHCNDSSAPVPQCHDASSPDLPLYANGSGGTAGNSGNC
jgi:hypothetical protein